MQNIIMTGTIVPQSNFTVIDDWRVRRAEYIKSINFYKKFGVVIYFIENSIYDIEGDNEFNQENLHIVKYIEDNKNSYNFGKGYQEFKMIDNFIDNNEAISSFFKITGRRIVSNFKFYIDKYNEEGKARFDVSRNFKFVDTSFFFCNRRFYIQHIKNKYAFVNDADGIFIERVLYREFIENNSYIFHFPTPRFHGVSGSSGERLNEKLWKISVKNVIRIVNLLSKKSTVDHPVVNFIKNKIALKE